MTETAPFTAEGGCDCRQVRYRMEARPLIVHCCHCRWCQRESGAAFALNAMIEADRVAVLGTEPEIVDTPSASGHGQKIARCPACRIAVWSNYAGAGPLISFVRVGTLDEPDRLPPDIHIFIASKQPWVVIPPGTPAVPEYYDRDRYWPPESLARRQVLLPRIEAYQAARNGARMATRGFVVSHADAASFERGLRSFLEYRDLGIKRATEGRVGAHVIRAAAGTEFSGQPHLHKTTFQLVYVIKGWIEFDYEGQGRVRLEAGSCVHQPPEIRHREVGHSEDIEMLEIVLPANFETQDVASVEDQDA